MRVSNDLEKYYDFVFAGKRECANAGMQDVLDELKKIVCKYKENNR